jgi:DNA topoisomerase-3
VLTKRVAISENQYIRLLQKGSTVNLKDFKTDLGTVEGLLRFDADFKLVLKPKKTSVQAMPDVMVCPKCQKGTIIKGHKAYGCSDYKLGCDFRVSFDVVKQEINGHKPTKELVYAILKENG